MEEELLPFAAVVEEVPTIPPTCRDRHDDVFLALAAAGRAAYLVSGDQDLLVLKSITRSGW